MCLNKTEFKIEVLKQEVELLVQRIRGFDDLRHRTKQMAATFWLAVIGAGLTIPSEPLLWLSLVVSMPFWFLDGSYNAYQCGFNRRFWAICHFVRDEKFADPEGNETSLEDCLAKDGFAIFPAPDYYGNKTFDKKRHSDQTNILRNAFTMKMLAFYASLLLGGVVILVLIKW